MCALRSGDLLAQQSPPYDGDNDNVDDYDDDNVDGGDDDDDDNVDGGDDEAVH